MADNLKIESTIVDLSYLNESFAEDLDAYAQMIQVFMMQTDGKVQELYEAVKEKDHEKTRNVAHFLKSTFDIMGLQCSSEVRKIEELAKSEEDFSKIEPLSKLVLDNFEESEDEFKRILSLISANN